jgi:hypothetical protein
MKKEEIVKEIDLSNKTIDEALVSLDQALATIDSENKKIAALVSEINALEIAAPVATGYPGKPAAGKIRWGCSYNSNGVPSPHEQAAGVPVGIRRTFWDMSKTTSLVSTVKADHTAGRLPWVSVKLGTTWKNVAAGQIDGALSTLFKTLGATGKPVWFTAHHEPEGGNGTPYPDDGQGTEVDWRNMQKQVRKVLDASGAKNIAFAPILMSWTFDTRSGRNPADWWVDGIWDFAGIDHYQDDPAATTMQTTMWKNTAAFYKAKGLDIAIGEWGNKDHGPTGAAEMQSWYNHLISIGSPGVCYFDTNLNGGVPLSAEALVKFRELMKAPTSVTGF